MTVYRTAIGLLCLLLLAGCGGSGGGGEAVAPPSTPRVCSGEVVAGPFVMRPAAATDMQILTADTVSGASFVVFSGVTIDYIAVRELMDRLVFPSMKTAEFQLYTCDFFGDNLTQITFNDRVDLDPEWSPDGTRIAWTYTAASPLNDEIYVRPADGGPATNLTNSPGTDAGPTWSPDGRWIAFETDRETDFDIYKMLADGSNQMPLTADGMTFDQVEPAWSPDGRKILYMSNQLFPHRIWLMNSDGTNQLGLGMEGRQPAWEPGSYRFAYRHWVSSDLEGEIFTADTTGALRDFSVSAEHEDGRPCYSSDGRYLFFYSARSGQYQIWAKQTRFPHRLYQITDTMYPNYWPDLGSPTVQTGRVLIGPPGSDHGYDPIHDAAVAGVVAFDYEGYLNFVRIGMPSSSGANLTIRPVEGTDVNTQANGLAVVITPGALGVVVSAPDMYYVEEDAGMGLPPTVWDFSGLTSRTAVLYFNAESGKLVAVMDMGDSVYTASTDGGVCISQEQRGPNAVVRGDFRRVYDSAGELIAEGDISEVEIDVASRVVRAF